MKCRGSAAGATSCVLLALLCGASCLQLAEFDELRFRDGVGGATAQGGGGATAQGGGGATVQGGGGTTAQGGREPTLALITPTAVRKLDLLVVIDNSPGMAEEQRLLADMLDSVVVRLLNPHCVGTDCCDPAEQPTGPEEPCPVAGSVREFAPVRDMHIGVLSTSLGGHGSDSCDPAASNNPRLDDRAHLLSADPNGEPVDTYQGLGFLAWDPDGVLLPPGQADASVLRESLRRIVLGVGDEGCPFPAPLESWYRFLVDPAPAADIEVEGGVAYPVGLDQELLAEREAFLRPDSSLAIVVAGTHNDCSIIDGGRYYQVAQQLDAETSEPHRMSRARADCDRAPTDPLYECCQPCGAAVPDGCPPDGPECLTPLTATEDPLRLRCFDQRRRFGADYLHPIGRYAAALGISEVGDEPAPIVNPIVPGSDADEPLAPRRHEGAVLLMSVVGVPWQDLARRVGGDGLPDLETGWNPAHEIVGGLMTGAELWRNEAWKIMLPLEVSGRDDLTIEQIDPRSGVHPLTGDPIEPPTEGFMANPMNGHERTIPARDDLQYACVFERSVPVDCSAPGAPSGCACAIDYETNPVCQADDDQYSTFQRAEAAYPGLRQLELTRDLRSRGLGASACPGAGTNPSLLDYGLNAAAAALAEALGAHFQDHYCFDQAFTRDSVADPSCMLLEATADDSCSCAEHLRVPVGEEHADIAAAIEQHPDFIDGGWSCLCALERVPHSGLKACQKEGIRPLVDADGERVQGWCVIDSLGVGDKSLMPGCMVGAPRMIRLAGDAAPQQGAGLFLWCP